VLSLFSELKDHCTVWNIFIFIKYYNLNITISERPVKSIRTGSLAGCGIAKWEDWTSNVFGPQNDVILLCTKTREIAVLTVMCKTTARKAVIFP
jgi:hypothetical protein